MSLQDRLDALKSDFETHQAPAHVVAAFKKATAELIAEKAADRALKVGDRIAPFKLTDSDGALVDSARLLAKGPAVVTFYRGAWCPYCNLDLQAIEAVAEDIRSLDASLVAISPQTPPNSRKLKEQHRLSFPILSDAGGKVAEAFGLRFRLPDELLPIYKGFGVDLPLINGDPSWTLPMPARYVIARDGSIVYAEVNPDYTRRPEPAELLPALLRLRRAAAAAA
jgi:peroxiredoxin